MFKKLGLSLVVSLILLTAQSVGAVPKLISYQGLLNNQNGVPVNGTVSFVFAIYAAPTGGTGLWTEGQTVSVSNGVFNVQLGAVTPLEPALFESSTLYLGVKVGADDEMVPRLKFASGTYSLRAGVAESLSGGVVPPNLFKDLQPLTGFEVLSRGQMTDADLATSGILQKSVGGGAWESGTLDYTFDTGRLLSASVKLDYRSVCRGGVVSGSVALFTLATSIDNLNYSTVDSFGIGCDSLGFVYGTRVLRDWWLLRFRYFRIRLVYTLGYYGGGPLAGMEIFELRAEEK